MPLTSITAKQENRVVELYERGTRLADICSDVGLNRSSVYWVLSKRGITPNRQARPTKLVAEGRVDIDIMRALLSMQTELAEHTRLLHQLLDELQAALRTIGAKNE